MLIPLLLKGLLAALIVGFVTASTQSWVDRFFLVIMLIGIVGLPITEAIPVNLIVVSLAALMMALRQGAVLDSVRQDWALVVISATVGAMLGRVLALSLAPTVLLAVLGIYAVLAGVRLAILDWRPDARSGKGPPRHHRLPPQQVEGFLRQAGFGSLQQTWQDEDAYLICAGQSTQERGGTR